MPRIPDPAYRARRGDRAVLFMYDAKRDVVRDAVAATSPSAYEAYWRSLEVADDDEYDDLRRAGRLVLLRPGTAVLVLEVEEFAPEDARADCATVRILDGPRKGEKSWVAAHDVARLVDNPDHATPGEAKARRDDSIEAARGRVKAYYDLPPEERRRIEEGARRQMAESDYNVAENLRRSGKADAARAYYEKVVRDYSDLPEAKAARERLKAMPKAAPRR